MITDLVQLKMFLPVPAFAAGISLFISFYSAACLLKESIKWKKHRTEIPDNDSIGNGTDISRYERIVRAETLKYTWYYSVMETVSILVMTAAVLLHGRIIKNTGISLYIPVLLISSLSAVFCILMKKRWKAAACDNLISCITLFSGAAGDFHAGIRMMLSVSGIDIPMKSVLEEIRNDTPGISGNDLMLLTGQILRSEKIINYSGQEIGQKKSKAGSEHSGRFDAYNSGFGIFSFGIILLLSLLFNF